MNPHDPKTAVVFDAEKIVEGQLDCGDNSCEFIFLLPRHLRGGMRTNGGCRCLQDDKYYAREIDNGPAPGWMYTQGAIRKLRRFIRLCGRTIAELQKQLDRHDQQGGILMPCKHPVQCAYPDGPDGKPACLMCDQDKKLRRLQERHDWVIQQWVDGVTVELEDPEDCDGPLILDSGLEGRRRYPHDWDLFISMAMKGEGELLPPEPFDPYKTRRGDPVR